MFQVQPTPSVQPLRPCFLRFASGRGIHHRHEPNGGSKDISCHAYGSSYHRVLGKRSHGHKRVQSRRAHPDVEGGEEGAVAVFHSSVSAAAAAAAAAASGQPPITNCLNSEGFDMSAAAGQQLISRCQWVCHAPCDFPAISPEYLTSFPLIL